MKRFLFHGKELTMREISEICGVKTATLHSRLHRGYTLEEATANACLSTTYEWRGEQLTLTEISNRSGISMHVLHDRVRRGGWTIEDATTVPVGSILAKTHKQRQQCDLPDDVSETPVEKEDQYLAAMRICKLIATGPYEWNFRCIKPKQEYAFEGDLVEYKIRFIDDNLALLNAKYKKTGMASSLDRRFLIKGEYIKPITNDEAAVCRISAKHRYTGR